jgi:hypothetical protein
MLEQQLALGVADELGDLAGKLLSGIRTPEIELCSSYAPLGSPGCAAGARKLIAMRL